MFIELNQVQDFSALVTKFTTDGAGVNLHRNRLKIKVTPNFVIRKDLTFSGLVPKSATSGASVAKMKMIANLVIRTDPILPWLVPNATASGAVTGYGSVL